MTPVLVRPTVMDPGVLRALRLDPQVLQKSATSAAVTEAERAKLGLLGVAGIAALGGAVWLWFRVQ